MARLRYRITLDVNPGNRLQRTNDSQMKDTAKKFAVTVAKGAFIKYADETYPALKQQIITELTKVVKAEINWIATLYSKYVMSIPAIADTPGQLKGELSSAYGGGTTMNLENLTPSWAPLNARWIARKNRGVGRKRGTKGFFEFTGELRQLMSSGNAWVEMFGPIRITVTRYGAKAATSGNVIIQEELTRDKIKVALATVRVSALTKITPAMLGALKDGSLSSHYTDGRNTGLINLVAETNPEMGYRLAGRERVPYRASLEPFLGFVLTRSIPSSVFASVSRGLNTMGAN